MQLQLFQVDAFTSRLFGGNPACVVPLQNWLPDPLLMNITRENAVAETAFFIPEGQGYALRWFTPEVEMDLCGHATLATAHVLKQHLGYTGQAVEFSSRSGPLRVMIEVDRYILDFPARKPHQAPLPGILKDSLNIQPAEVYKSRDYMLVYKSEEEIRQLQPNRMLLENMQMGVGGIIATAPGIEADFVSRFFIPGASIFEDPVTGSAHCSLIPFWSHRLHKKEMTAWQLSARTGMLFCSDQGSRVFIGGQARTYSTGTLRTE